MTGRTWAILKVITPIIVGVIAVVPPIITAMKPTQASKPQDIHMGPGSVVIYGDVREGSTISPISIQGWVEGIRVIKNMLVPEQEPAKVNSNFDKKEPISSPTYTPVFKSGHPANTESAGFQMSPITKSNEIVTLDKGTDQSESSKQNEDEGKIATTPRSVSGDWVIDNKLSLVGITIRQNLYSDVSRAYTMLCPGSPLKTSLDEFANKRNEWEWASYGRLSKRPLNAESLDFPYAVFKSEIKEKFADGVEQVTVVGSERVKVKLDSNYGLECVWSVDQAFRSPRQDCLRGNMNGYECLRFKQALLPK